jgi:pSer/pThr/pTyr-binding forkhead associated (FHA) protein
MADQTYFERVEADGVNFPVGGTDRRFCLVRDRASIGRRSASRGIYPDIDLSGPPTDTGVSHLHAVLVRGVGDNWAIIDPGSTNGTYLNDSLEAIPTDELIPVAEGDRIHIGAWTTLTLHSTAPSPESADQQ